MARLTDWITRNAQLASGIPPLGPDEHIALVNTITFHGKRKDQFKRTDTRLGEFHHEDGTTKTLPMMSRSGTILEIGGRLLLKEIDYTVANLLYGDGSMSIFTEQAHAITHIV